MSTDQRSDLYFKVYTAQKGGELPAYRGTRKIQYGSGFGDILRSINRHVLPITAEHASLIAPPSKTMLEAPAKPNTEELTGKDAISSSEEHKKKRAPKKKPVYKGKKRRTKKRKVTFSKDSSKIPNFNF